MLCLFCQEFPVSTEMIDNESLSHPLGTIFWLNGSFVNFIPYVQDFKCCYGVPSLEVEKDRIIEDLDVSEKGDGSLWWSWDI